MIITLLKWLGILLAGFLILVALFFVGMRFHDGPMEIISGGPFKTGEPAATPDSWDFLKDRLEIEFQTMDPATSRIVWLGVHEGRLFLISGYMTTGYGKLWKQWPHYLEEDNRVLVRVDGKIYAQQLTRIMEGDMIQPVLDEFQRKYGVVGSPESVARGEVWFYEVVPQ